MPFGWSRLGSKSTMPILLHCIEDSRFMKEQESVAPENPQAELIGARERLSATQEILEVISQSRDDEMPVFDRILERAAKLCGASSAGLQLVNDDRTRFRYVCKWGEDRSGFTYGESWPLGDSPLMVPTAIREARVVHNADISDDPIYRSGEPTRVRLVEQEGIRTYLVVPLVIGKVAVGTITLIRREVRPFSEDQISLVETFAAQAVIAIENVRQFREVQQRLAREKASAEVLAAISTNRDNEAPVFRTILERVSKLCQSDYAGLAVVNADRSHLVYTASHGPELAHSQYGDMKWTLDGASSFAEAVRKRVPVQVADLRDTDLYRSGDPQRVAHADKDGIRTFLAVPMFQNS